MPLPLLLLEERGGERRPFSAANLNFFTPSDPLRALSISPWLALKAELLVLLDYDDNRD